MFEQNPDIQDKAREEVRKFIGDKPIPDWDDIKKLTYLDNCIKETIRLYPPAAAISRILEEDEEVFGYHINKGTMITIPVLQIHRNPEYFKDPLKFNPDRFITDKIIPNTYLPFSLGPRACIGQNFAMLEMRLLLALLLRHFVFVPDLNTKVKFEMQINTTPEPKTGHTLLVKKIK